MQPEFQLLADKQDITARLQDRLLALHITDEAGFRSDTVELHLDDRDAKIEWPKHGAELDVSLGYRQTGLTAMGRYVVDEIAYTSPPNTLIIHSQAIDRQRSLHSKQTRSWSNITLADLVTTIAAEHGLTAKVAHHLADIPINHLDQIDESDGHLLTRLANHYDAIAKPASGHLLFLSCGEAQTAGGQVLPVQTMPLTSIIRHRFTQAQRSKYAAVRAYWHDPTTATTAAVIAREGDPVHSLRHPYANAEEALRAATAKLDALQRGAAQLSLAVLGDPALQAESKIQLSNIRPPIDGEWLVQRVEHQFDQNGFVSRLEAEAPKS
jgi:phage protein D